MLTLLRARGYSNACLQGAVEVNLDAPITVRFNEEIDVTNLPGDVFDVREAGSTTVWLVTFRSARKGWWI